MSKYEDLPEKWLIQLKRGDVKAYKLLFDSYHKLLYAVAYKHLNSRDAAEDAVQHTFITVWEKRHLFDFSSGIRSLLFTILKNYLLNEIRHANVVLNAHMRIAHEGADIASEQLDYLEKEEIHDTLIQSIKRLPPQKQIICNYKMQDELTNQEIAEKMQISEATVKSHYTTALKMLRKDMEKLMLLILLIK